MSVKTSINIPDGIFDEAKKLSENFSSVVADALKEYIRKKKVEKAAASFAKWGKRDKKSTKIVNDMRKEESRSYANRSR